MKKLLLLVFVVLGIQSVAQQTIVDSIMHDGIYRSYTLYVPAIYSASSEVPLVMNFHGYTSNMNEQMLYGDFRSIADTANFILVHPQGTKDGSGFNYWNSGWGGTVDDIGFTEALIDSLSANYSINQNRVYSTGMSNGGFMSYTLACELSDRIAAIASVTGSMNAAQNLTCSSSHPMPVMEIHGTADGTVPYNGTTGMSPIDDVLSYWSTFNQCDATPTMTSVPDINMTDGCTAEHYVYENGTNGVEVEHYKIINGAHSWPGAPIAIGTTNYDISASFKIWEFFAKYDINGRIQGGPTSIEEASAIKNIIFPNPSNGIINLKGEKNLTVEIYDLSGRLVREVAILGTDSQSIVLPQGSYLVVFENEAGRLVEKIVVTK